MSRYSRQCTRDQWDPFWSTAQQHGLQLKRPTNNPYTRFKTRHYASWSAQWSRITFMEQTTTIQPLQQRRQAKVLLQAKKCKCLPDHPMKEKVEGRTKNRIKRGSITHAVKKLHKDYTAVLTIPTLPLSKQDFTNPCENTTSEIQINTTIPQLDHDNDLDACLVGIITFWACLCIGTTLANLNGLENSALDMLRFTICVSARAIIASSIF